MGFSVPFFGALAFSAAWFAAYRVWKVEHEKVVNLEAQLGATKLREIEAQETHAAELRRHTDALERQYRPPALENMTEFHDVPYVAIGKIADALDPAGMPSSYDDQILLKVHAELERIGRAYPDRMVSVFHRNVVLSAVAKALRKYIPE